MWAQTWRPPCPQAWTVCFAETVGGWWEGVGLRAFHWRWENTSHTRRGQGGRKLPCQDLQCTRQDPRQPFLDGFHLLGESPWWGVRRAGLRREAPKSP